MGLFGFGKKNKEARKAGAERSAQSLPHKSMVVEPAPTVPLTAGLKAEGFSSVLLGPRITEKATMVSDKLSVYTFNVSHDANKHTVAQAVERLYKVHPRKVHIVTIPLKQVLVRGKWGTKRGGRKAYVYLKEGEKIETV